MRRSILSWVLLLVVAGCDSSGSDAGDAQVESELWMVQQAPHLPDFTDDARELWFDWLFAFPHD